jgi:hypothetical protein
LKGLDSANFKVEKKSKKKRKMDDELSRNCADGVAISTVLDRQGEEVETTDTACKAVFDTAELLENILIHLPPREIFKVRESPGASKTRRSIPCSFSKRCSCDREISLQPFGVCYVLHISSRRRNSTGMLSRQ